MTDLEQDSNEQMPPSVTLQAATQDDIELLMYADIEAKIAATGSGFSPDVIEERRNKLESIINGDDPVMRLYVLKSEGRSVGAVSVNISPKPLGELAAELAQQTGDSLEDIDIPGFRWHVHGVAIPEQYRRQGHLKEGFPLFENMARSKGAKYLTMDTGINNEPMIAAARLLGFQLFKDSKAEEHGYTQGTKLIGIKVLS